MGAMVTAPRDHGPSGSPCFRTGLQTGARDSGLGGLDGMSGQEIIIDGSQGEGGGQVLRTSLSLSAAMGLPVRVRDIRARRPKPGLRPQHLVAVRAAAAVCGARVRGDEPGSAELSFSPGALRGGSFRFDIGTAGSTTLVLQTVIPALMVCGQDAEVLVSGGTHNPMAPCFEYARDVFGLLGSAMNLQAYFEMSRAGFYPRGGGRVRLAIRGLDDAEDLAPIRLASRGPLKYVEGLSAAGGSLPESIADRQARRALARLSAAGLSASIEQARWPSDSAGTVVFLRAVFSRTVAGFFALGARGKPAEAVADEAVDGLLEFLDSDGVVDVHAADQLLTLAAVCPEESYFYTQRISEHLRTNAEVIRRMTGREVELAMDGPDVGLVFVGEM